MNVQGNKRQSPGRHPVSVISLADNPRRGYGARPSLPGKRAWMAEASGPAGQRPPPTGAEISWPLILAISVPRMF